MCENVELTLICMYQVAVVIKDREYVDSYMDSKPWQAGKFANSMRMSLWREHLGLQHSEVLSLYLSHIIFICANLSEYFWKHICECSYKLFQCFLREYFSGNITLSH